MIMYAFRQGMKNLNNNCNMTIEPFILRNLRVLRFYLLDEYGMLT
jgi:hypothetical protein